MDLDLVKKAFDEYVSNYDMNVKEIKLKYYHSYKVMDLMKELSYALNLNEEETILAQIIGLLHDIGRFEQFKFYKTFSDRKSVDHADESVVYLFDKGHIRDFVTDDKYDDIIKKAIKNHNKKFIDENITDEKELLFAKMIRDTDKIDIFRVKAVEYDLSFNAEEVSKNILNDFKEFKVIDNKDVKSKSDALILTLGFTYDIYFEESYDLLVETDNFDLFLGSIDVDQNS